MYQIEDPGAGYSANYTQAPRATLVTAWGDIYHGKRQSWDSHGTPLNLQYVYPDGLYWNESTQLLYWTYYDAYNVTSQPRLGSGRDATGRSSQRRVHCVRPLEDDREGRRRPDVLRPVALPLPVQQPAGRVDDVRLNAHERQLGEPVGPDAYGGHAWPTAATAAGFGTPDLNLPSRYLEHYFMGNSLSSNYIDQNSVVHGHLRSFRRTNELPVWEPQALRANPSLNGGVGSWSELDGRRCHLAGAHQ